MILEQLDQGETILRSHRASRMKKVALVVGITLLLGVLAGCTGALGISGIPPETLDVLYKGRIFKLAIEQEAKELWEFRDLVKADYREARRLYLQTWLEWNGWLQGAQDALDFGQLEGFKPFEEASTHAVLVGKLFFQQAAKTRLEAQKQAPGVVEVQTGAVEQITVRVNALQALVEAFTKFWKTITGEEVRQANRMTLKVKLKELELREFDCITELKCPK